MKNIALSLILTGLCASFFVSCVSAKVEIPYDATDREIIQTAQNEYDAGHVTRALDCYNTLLMRYGNDTALYVEGRYEIAHIYIKQKKYSEAQEILEEIIAIYDGSAPGMLPGAFNKLARADLEKIPEGKKTTKISTGIATE